MKIMVEVRKFSDENSFSFHSINSVERKILQEVHIYTENSWN